MVVVGIKRTISPGFSCDECEKPLGEFHYQTDHAITRHGYWYSCLDCARELGLLW
jgi:hypothetical protein